MAAITEEDLAEEVCRWNCSNLHGKTFLIGRSMWLDFHMRKIATILRDPKLPIHGLEVSRRHIALIPYQNFITGIVPDNIDKFRGYRGRRILVVKEMNSWPGNEWDLALEAICCGPECDIWEV